MHASLRFRRLGTFRLQYALAVASAVGVSLMGVLLQRYINAAKDPLSARAQLQAGLQADFVVLVVLAALMFRK